MNIKIIINDKMRDFTDKSAAIKFLEGEQEGNKSYEEILAERLLPVFKKYPKIEEITLFALGNYYQYESAGTSYFSDCGELNDELCYGPRRFGRSNFTGPQYEPPYEDMDDIICEFSEAADELICQNEVERQYDYDAPGMKLIAKMNKDRVIFYESEYDPE